MGKVWGPDAVAKNVSTSFYGNIVALAESPLQEGLLYVGTDDGLIQVTDNGGKSWQKIEAFPGVPEKAYVSRLLASPSNAKTVYAGFENHKNADFAPYLLKSTDAGKTWKSIKGDLPANGPVLAIAEDGVDANLLFAGTEFGLYFTTNGGTKWIRFKSGLPTIAVRDLAIQKQMNDLVIGTFGRGIYVLDDYSALRRLTEEKLSAAALLFSTREAHLYIPARPLGGIGKAYQGSAFYMADNPPFGATFTYFLKAGLKTKKQERRAAEKAGARKGEKSAYPSKDQLRSEEEQEPPSVLLTIRDATGAAIRTLTGSTEAGIHRVTWDLRSADPASGGGRPRGGDGDEDEGRPRRRSAGVAGNLSGEPGTTRGRRQHSFSRPTRIQGRRRWLPDHETRRSRFPAGFPNQSGQAPAARPTGRLFSVGHRFGAEQSPKRSSRAIDLTPAMDEKWKGAVVRDLEKGTREIMLHLRVTPFSRARNENTPESILERIGQVIGRTNDFLLRRPTQNRRRFLQDRSRGTCRPDRKNSVACWKKICNHWRKPWTTPERRWTPGRVPMIPKEE